MHTVENIVIENDSLIVYAIVEDINIVSYATFRDPMEYGPAYCWTAIQFGEDLPLPVDLKELDLYLKDAEWFLEDCD